MTVHIVMPARRSHVPGHWVRRCTAEGCGWVAHHPDRDVLGELAAEHRADPDAGTEAAGVPA